MTEHDELQQLRQEMERSSLGDKPYSIAANKLRRLIELESKERDEAVAYCWVCRSHHKLEAAYCRAMDSIA
jgi:hypothetical protein